MVVHIKNPTSPIKVDIEIKKNRNNLTPDYIIELLEKSNHYGNIRKILKEITKPANHPENDDFENQMELRNIAKKYKKVILELVDKREHITDNLATIKKIADAGGYLKEVEALDTAPKLYNKTENKVLYVTKQQQISINNLSSFDILILDTHEQDIFISNSNYIKHYEIIKAPNLSFIKSDLTNTTINVSPQTKLTYHSSTIELHHLELPANSIILEASTNVLDAKNRDYIQFKANQVILNSTSSLRKKILNFSQSAMVHINDALYNVEELKFKPDSIVVMNWCRNFPQKLDLSMCKEVNLYHANLSNVSEIIFKNEAQKNRFLQDSIESHNIKCTYTNLPIQPHPLQTYSR